MATEIRSILALADPGGYDHWYTTVSAWITAVEGRGKDLVTRDNQETLYCKNDWPSGLNDTLSTTAGWTTNSSCFLKIKGLDKTNGALDGGFWLKSAATFGIIRPRQPYFVVEDIGIQSTSTGAGICIRFDQEYYCNVIGCFLECSGNSPAIFDHRRGNLRNIIAITPQAASGTIQMVNQSADGPTLFVQNVTLIGGAYSLELIGLHGTFQNVICYGYATASANQIVTGTGTRSNNISNDGVLTGDLGITLTDADFENPSGNDYHLASGSQAIDQGANLSPDVVDDIDGDSRPQGSAYDVGADERTGAAPPSAKQNAIFMGVDF